MTPNKETSPTNEVTFVFSEDATTITATVVAARKTGLKLLISKENYPKVPGISYLD